MELPESRLKRKWVGKDGGRSAWEFGSKKPLRYNSSQMAGEKGVEMRDPWEWALHFKIVFLTHPFHLECLERG